jgi:hypothetical protein
MIGDWDDLAYNKNPDHKEYDEIKAWLRSQTQNLETTVSNTSHPLELLRAALRSAIYEIRDNFDKQISLLVVEAGQHNKATITQLELTTGMACFRRISTRWEWRSVLV